MRFLIQEVQRARLSIDTKIYSQIARGALIYLGISQNDLEDYQSKITKFSSKIGNTKMFKSKEGKLEATLEDIEGEILIVSNFTLYGENNKGSKINFSKSADFDTAQKIYDELVLELQKHYIVKTGKFGAMMNIESTNNGPINYLRNY